MSSSIRKWKYVLTCVAVAALTSGCATTASPPAPAPSAASPATGKAKQRLLTRAEQLEEARAVRTSTGPLPAPAGGPPPVSFDIGESCLMYRYSEESHCPSDVQLADCQAATSNGDCGLKLPFVLTNTWCAQVQTGELQKWHVFCQGYVPSGPLPQPQCPDGHVLGVWGQECDGSCTMHCADHCIGGYCTGGAYNLCYLEYQPECDCGVVTCPCTGPDCDASSKGGR